ncbi:MAG: hypothetical protein AB1767_00005 [Bacillota bacterium]
MRLFSILLITVCLMFTLVAGCSQVEAPGQEPGNGSGDALAAFKAWFADNYGDAAWYGQAGEIKQVARLRKPAVLLFVDLDSSAFMNEANELLNAWSNSEHSGEAALRIVLSDGSVLAVPLSLELAGSVPPPPASAADFMIWLDTAFGPAGGDPVNEEWYGRIKSAALNAQRQSIEIETDLNFGSPADRELAEAISQVLQLARPADVPCWRVLFADGANELSGSF